jgi:hypothetical protein
MTAERRTQFFEKHLQAAAVSVGRAGAGRLLANRQQHIDTGEAYQ